MNKRRSSMNRRNFLRAAGGLLVALPLLNAFKARAQEVVYPKRLILIYNPNGVVQDAFWPVNVVDERTWDLGEIMQPLVNHRDRLLLLKGLSIQVAQVGPGGPHQKGVGGLFTGRELLSGDFVDGCGSRAGWANGISVDQQVASILGTDTFLGSLELGVRAAKTDVQSRISYAAAAQPLPPTNSPLEIYTRLFSDIGTDVAAIGELREQRHSVLDAVQEQFAAIDARVGAADREKLEQHLTLVRDVERRLDIVATNASCVPPAQPPDLAQDSEDTMVQIAQLQVDLLSVALACDLTRVASLQFSDGLNTIRFPWINSLVEGHPLSHSGPSDLDARAQLIGRQKWYVEQVTRLLDNLAAIPEGTGSLLDNTLIVWGNEIGVGNTHTHDNIPFLLAGSAGGVLQTGRFIDFGGKSHCDLLVSMLNAMGIDMQTFGHPDFVTGPLPGLTV